MDSIYKLFRFIIFVYFFNMSFPQAGSIVDKLKRKSGSIRSLCFASHIRNKKEVYALVCETLRCM